ncbi:MAG: hypothetical protein SGILL_006283 [Bacillariaceae sp.]
MRFLKRNKKDGTAAKKGKNDQTSRLPSVEVRQVVRDRVMTTAASIYIHLAVNTSLDLEDDPDLSKEAKAKKKQEQQQAHEAYKNRMKAILGSHSLLPVVSTCLLLDSQEDQKSNGSKRQPEKQVPPLSLHDSFACIALLISNYIPLTASNGSNGDSEKTAAVGSGYDARVRNVLRMASVELLVEATKREDRDGNFLKALQQQRQPRAKVSLDQEDTTPELSNIVVEEKKKNSTPKDPNNDATEQTQNPTGYDDLYRQYATRKFQALEQAIADLLLDQMLEQEAKPSQPSKETEENGESATSSGISRKSMIRAAKIGGVGLAAGTLFAVTGGLAAPGIAAGLAAIGVGGTALTLASSSAAIITLFGVGGGGLASYKMKRRTDGLTEFNIQQSDVEVTKAHLHTTVCVSGWVNDEKDFERPWGIEARSLSRLERLQRFFSIVDPEKVDDAKSLLKPYSNNNTSEDKELWKAFSMAMEERYGKSPDELLPLEDRRTELSKDEDSTLQQVFNVILQSKNTTGDRSPSQDKRRVRPSKVSLPLLGDTHVKQSAIEQEDTSAIRVWDYQTEFGGDVYTVHWENTLLRKTCQVATNLALDVAGKATQEVLKVTILASLMTAIAWPTLLVGLAGALDNDWTLITIRSDLAGKELAKSLLQSNEKRPVKLLGYSFGARVVYSCLMELAKHQTIWEEQQQPGNNRFVTSLKSNGKERIKYTREPASIVQDVILMGAPLFVSRSKLRLARHLVAGRFVNCFSRNDWILSLMFQYKSPSGITRGTCGTNFITGVNNIENYDVSEMVSSWHANYCRFLPDILDMVGFDQPMAFESSLG